MKYSIFLTPLAAESIQSLANQKLPIKVAYKVANILKLIGEEEETFNKLRLEVLKRHSELDDEGNLVKKENGDVTILNPEGFMKDWNELASIEVPVPSPITFNELGSVEFSGSVVSLMVEHGIFVE